jgi:hypothetical protein
MTVTWTAPDPDGAVAISEVAVMFVIAAAGVVPKKTVSVVVKCVPVTVIVVPPLRGPPEGEIFVIEGCVVVTA